MTPEEEKRINDRFERIEANLDRLALGLTRIGMNFEAFQNLVSQAFGRSEVRLEQLDIRINRIAELLERHVSDGHGGEKEDEQP